MGGDEAEDAASLGEELESGEEDTGIPSPRPHHHHVLVHHHVMRRPGADENNVNEDEDDEDDDKHGTQLNTQSQLSFM